MKYIKNKSGLYIVTLNNITPIPVNAHDSRRSHKSIKVNYLNCKFGKAKCLMKRKRNYEKTFGAENVNFYPFVFMQEFDVAEQIVLKELYSFRIKGLTGRRNEWLKDIDQETLYRVIYTVLKSHNFNLLRISDMSDFIKAA